MKLEYTVDKNTRYTNVKQIIKNIFDVSDRLLIKLKKNHKIYVNNSPAKVYDQIHTFDVITIDLDFEEESENIVPTKMDLDILYEDDALLILNKPPFMPVHPSLNHFEDSLSNGVKYYFNSNGIKRKIRPINRLDKDTSGIVLFAKNEYIQECLIKQMKTGDFKKEYYAILEGNLKNNIQIIEAPIRRKTTSIIERCVSDNGDYAKTIVELIKNFENYCLVKCTLETGRTHQIRVHTAYIFHPIIGDTLYSTSSNLITRQALHATCVTFTHPLSKNIIKIDCNLPQDMANITHNV